MNFNLWETKLKDISSKDQKPDSLKDKKDIAC